MNEYIMDGLSIKEHLFRLADSGNKSFTRSLHPGVEHILGIRIPDLRILAKRIAHSDWKSYLDSADTFYMEERTLQGLVLGYVRPTNVEAYLQRVSSFVGVINSWSVCDTFTFAGGKRFALQNESVVWPFLLRWMQADSEYEIRFGVVMAMKYYVDEVHLDSLFSQLEHIHHEGYYVKMAVAWALSVCFVYFPERTLHFLYHNTLDEFTYNKTLQKIVESYRVSSETKEQIKLLKR